MYHIMNTPEAHVALYTTRAVRADILRTCPGRFVHVGLSQSENLALSLDQALALSRSLDVMFLEIALTSASQQTDLFSVSVPIGSIFPEE